MDFPSINDLFLITILIIPGFFALMIIRYIGQLKRIISEKEIAYFSLTGSLIVYLFFASIAYLFNIEQFQSNSNYEQLNYILIQPKYTAFFLGIVIFTSVIVGLIIKYLRKNKGYILEDVWTYAIDKKRTNPCVLIHTSDGYEYSGIIKNYGIEDEPKSLTLINPIRVIRNNKLDYDEKKSYYIGEEMYFSEKNISRIIFLEDETDGETQQEKIETKENNDFINTPSNKIFLADKTIESILILLSILQAVLFQLLTWLMDPQKEMIKGIILSVIFILPFIISFSFLTRAQLTNEINKKTILYRLISIASMNAGFTIFISFVAVFMFIKIMLLDINVGLILTLIMQFLLNTFCMPFSDILNNYKDATGNLIQWNKWYTKNLSFLLYFIFILIFLLLFIYIGI